MGTWGDVWGGAKRLGTAVATGGASEVYRLGKDAYNSTYGKAADEQKAAYDKAAQDYQQLGSNVQRDYIGLNKTTQGYFDPAQADLQAQRNNRPTQQQDYFEYAKYRAGQPTAEENFLDYYKNFAGQKTAQENLLANDTYGNSPTDVEQLYQERKNGSDPAATYQDSRAAEALNNQFAAKGGYNSGAANRGLTDYYANANAQRSQQLASLATASSGAAGSRAGYRSTLATGADTSRAGVNDAYGRASAGADTSRLNVDKEAGSAAQGASKEQSDYYGGITDRSTKLAAAQAGISEDLGSKAIEAYKSGQVASIQAYLAQSGVDAATIQAFVDTLSKTVKAGTEIAAAAA